MISQLTRFTWPRLEEGYAHAARTEHKIHHQIEDLPSTWERGEQRRELAPARIAWMDHSGIAVDTQDHRGAVEPPHERHPWVFSHVSDVFVLAARQIEPHNPVWAEHPQ